MAAMRQMPVAVLLSRLLLSCLLLAGGAAHGADTLPAPAELEAAGARIGTITIRALEIFDTSDPAENRLLYRAANRLHRRTREAVLRTELLFASGDRYSQRLLEETERNLRELRYLREPKIRVVGWHDGVVDIEVITHDVWTLQFGPSFSRSGGHNSSGFSVEDQNLLGYGKTLSIGSHNDVDRSSNFLSWYDPAVWSSRWQDELYWSDNSDGQVWHVAVWRPFYALNTRRAYGLVFGNGSTVDTRYRLGDAWDNFRHNRDFLDGYIGWSRGLEAGRALRLRTGVAIERDVFRVAPGVLNLAPLPASRRLSYPYVRLDWVRDHFQTTSNLELIARTEDLQFGLNANLTLGQASRSFGADRSATIYAGAATYGKDLSARRQLFLSGALSGRVENGTSVDQRWSVSGAWYQRTSRRTLFHAKYTAAGGTRLDLDHYYELGGNNGLRGYPQRYQQGSGLNLVKVEERLYTPWSLWRLLDIGAAAFIDAGRVTGRNPIGAPTFGWLRDAGIGLRFGNSRSSLGNVIHVDLATPFDGESRIDRLQLLISTEATF
jgi:hypothetical protein